MKKIFFQVLLLITALSTFNCRKNNDGATTFPNILNEKAHIIESNSIIKSDSVSVVLQKNNLSFTPSIGSILIASPSVKDTLGLLVKITSMVANGDEFICSTIPCGLNEAFDQLSINYTYNQNYQSSTTYKGTALSNAFQHFTIGNLDISGNLELHLPETNIKYVKRKGNLLPDLVAVSASFDTEGSSIEIEGSAAQIPEVTLKEFNVLPVILVPVPVGPAIVTIPFVQKLDLKILPASISGKFKLNFLPVVHASLGFSYENGNWKNLSGFSIDASAEDISGKKNDFDASVQASLTFIKPVYEIAPMGSDNLKGYFEIPNNLEFTVQDHSPNYKLNYALNVETGIQYKFWTGVEGNLSASANLIDENILEGNWLYNIGDTAFGGIIFYLDSTRQHGLACAPSDQNTGNEASFSDSPPLLSCEEILATEAYWQCFWENSGNAAHTCIQTYDSRIGAGAAKTDSIAFVFGPATPNVAQLCKLYLGGGYADWYLPSLEELNKLYLNKDSSAAFPKTGKYFSSSLGCQYGCGIAGTSTLMWVEGKDFSTGGPPDLTWGAFLYQKEDNIHGNRPWVDEYDYGKVRAIRKF